MLRGARRGRHEARHGQRWRRPRPGPSPAVQRCSQSIGPAPEEHTCNRCAHLGGAVMFSCWAEQATCSSTDRSARHAAAVVLAQLAASASSIAALDLRAPGGRRSPAPPAGARAVCARPTTELCELQGMEGRRAQCTARRHEKKQGKRDQVETPHKPSSTADGSRRQQQAHLLSHQQLQEGLARRSRCSLQHLGAATGFQCL